MIAERIQQLICEQLAESGIAVSSPLSFETRLVDLGLDSLGFAIIVARLEEETGNDPFGPGKGASYPTNVGELIRLYSGNS